MTAAPRETLVCQYCLKEELKRDILDATLDPYVEKIVKEATANSESDQFYPIVCIKCIVKMNIKRDFTLLTQSKFSSGDIRPIVESAFNKAETVDDKMLKISDVRTLTATPGLLTEIGSCRYEDREEAFELEQAKALKTLARNKPKKLPQPPTFQSIAKRRQSRSRSTNYVEHVPLRISVGCKIELALLDDFHEFTCKVCLGVKLAMPPKRREIRAKSIATFEVSKTPKRRSTRAKSMAPALFSKTLANESHEPLSSDTAAGMTAKRRSTRAKSMAPATFSKANANETRNGASSKKKLEKTAKRRSTRAKSMAPATFSMKPPNESPQNHSSKARRRQSIQSAKSYIGSRSKGKEAKTTMIDHKIEKPPLYPSFCVPKFFVCSAFECSKFFISLAECVRHEYEVHSQMLMHRCEECDQWFTSRNHLLLHDDQSHKRPDFYYKCFKCDSSFNKLYQLDEHMKRHKRDWKCARCCNRHFSTKSKYYDHLYDVYTRKRGSIRIIDRRDYLTKKTAAVDGAPNLMYKARIMIQSKTNSIQRPEPYTPLSIILPARGKYDGIRKNVVHQKLHESTRTTQKQRVKEFCSTWVNDFDSDCDDVQLYDEAESNKALWWRDRFSLPRDDTLFDGATHEPFKAPDHHSNNVHNFHSNRLFAGTISYGGAPFEYINDSKLSKQINRRRLTIPQMICGKIATYEDIAIFSEYHQEPFDVKWPLN